MPQSRYWDYGTPLETLDSIFLNSKLLDAGVYSGLELAADPSGLLLILPGVGLQPDGIAWEETTNISVAFTPPGAPTEYTVVASHQLILQFGGSAVEYSIQPGILSSLSGGVILGWIYHPGGGSPLSTAVLVNAPKALGHTYVQEALNLRSVELFPSYPRCYVDTAVGGADITFVPQAFEIVGQFLLYQAVTNSPTAPGTEQWVQHFQFFVDEAPRPVSFSFYCNVPNSPGNDITIQVYDSNQVLVPVDPVTITSTTGWETRVCTVDNSTGTFSAGTPYTMRMVTHVDPNQTIKVGRIKASFWPYP